MYHNHQFNDINDALPKLMRHVLEEGDEVGARQGSRTLELTHVGTTLVHPWRREILFPGRKVNLAAQIAETMWVLSGRNDIEFLSHYLPRAEDFSDDGTTWRAGYGPRLRAWENITEDGFEHNIDQLAEVVRILSEDRGSRRAVMSIFDPASDYQDSKDIPCNNWLSFISRLGKLDLHVAIRSNDLMWGWSGINAFEWSALQEIVAGLLGIEVGGLHFSTTSLHLYDHYWSKAAKIAHSDHWVSPTEDSPRFHIDEDFRSVDSFDNLVHEWFGVEEMIRTGQISRSRWMVEDFPEPMMKSWLRVLQWWWTNDRAHLAQLEGTRLEAATHYSVQPKAAVVDHEGTFRPDHPESSCENCGHSSDCSTHNTPAMAPRPCDCKSKKTPAPSAFIVAATELHCEKHAAYGDSWKRRGEMLGIIANIARKIDRLGKGETSDETSADTAMDLMVYLAKYETWITDSPDEAYSDDPHAANKILFDIDAEWDWSPNVYDLRMIETGLHEGFDQLERTVLNDEIAVKLNLVRLMQRDSYRLARTLWEREQSPAVRNATRSWNPEQDDDRGKVQQAHPASAPGELGSL